MSPMSQIADGLGQPRRFPMSSISLYEHRDFSPPPRVSPRERIGPSSSGGGGGGDWYAIPIGIAFLTCLAWIGLRGAWNLLHAIWDSPVKWLIAILALALALYGQVRLRSLHQRTRRRLFRIAFWAFLPLWIGSLVWWCKWYDNRPGELTRRLKNLDAQIERYRREYQVSGSGEDQTRLMECLAEQDRVKKQLASYDSDTPRSSPGTKKRTEMGHR